MSAELCTRTEKSIGNRGRPAAVLLVFISFVLGRLYQTFSVEKTMSVGGGSTGTRVVDGTCVKSWRLHGETCQAGVEAAKSFEKVYDSGFWQSKGTASDFKKLGSQFYYHDTHQAVNGRQCLTFRQSLSGTGSNKGVASSRSLKYLAKAVIENKITSVLDAPCGDANWQFDDFATDSLPVYLGMDIVQSVIKNDNERFCHHANKRFLQWDVALCSLPKWSTAQTSRMPFELVHMRDVIQHILLESGCSALQNVVTSGVRHQQIHSKHAC